MSSSVEQPAVNRSAGISPARIALAAALVVLATSMALAALQPSAAGAQSSAVREQYDLQLDTERSTPAAAPAPVEANPPAGTRATAPREREADAEEPRAAPLTAAAPTGAASGELPLGGYPLTPFVMLLLALLCGGLLVRAGLAVRDRLSGRHPGPPGGAA